MKSYCEAGVLWGKVDGDVLKILHDGLVDRFEGSTQDGLVGILEDGEPEVGDALHLPLVPATLLLQLVDHLLQRLVLPLQLDAGRLILAPYDLLPLTIVLCIQCLKFQVQLVTLFVVTNLKVI